MKINIKKEGEFMSVLVLGGHECMEKDYKEILREKGYRTKIYTKMPSGLKKRIGNPDAIVLLMSTISHSMAEVAIRDAKKKRIPIIKVKNSSKEAFCDCIKDIDKCIGDCSNCKLNCIS